MLNDGDDDGDDNNDDEANGRNIQEQEANK